MYSNRSAANFKLNKFKEAIADATKCIDLDGNWAKGYTRKGDALYSSWKYTDAYNAYNSAKRLSPTDKSLIDKCELAMKAMRSEADRAAGPSSNTPNSTSINIVPTGRLGKLVYYARCFLLFSAFLYLLPFGRAYSGIVFKYVRLPFIFSHPILLTIAAAFIPTFILRIVPNSAQPYKNLRIEF